MSTGEQELSTVRAGCWNHLSHPALCLWHESGALLLSPALTSMGKIVSVSHARWLARVVPCPWEAVKLTTTGAEEPWPS